METISRRNFLTLGALGAAGAAIGLAGCTPQAPAEKGALSATGAEGATGRGTINCSGIVVNPAEVNEVYTTDILVVGGGLSGLAAAVQATQNGDAMILLEGQATLGGNGQGVEGTFAINSRFQKEQGVEIEPWEIMREELGKTQWAADGLLYKDLIDNAADNLHWLVDECGCELEGKIDNYPCGTGEGKVDSFHWWKEGVAYLGYVRPMEQVLRDAGADIRLNTRGLEFSYDDAGAVNGVYAQDAFGDIVKFEAKQVIIATGGFANDDDRLTKMGFDLTTLDRIGMPGHWGDGVNMTVAAGVAEFPGVCYLKYNCISHMTETFGPFWGLRLRRSLPVAEPGKRPFRGRERVVLGRQHHEPDHPHPYPGRRGLLGVRRGHLHQGHRRQRRGRGPVGDAQRPARGDRGHDLGRRRRVARRLAG